MGCGRRAAPASVMLVATATVPVEQAVQVELLGAEPDVRRAVKKERGRAVAQNRQGLLGWMFNIDEAWVGSRRRGGSAGRRAASSPRAKRHATDSRAQRSTAPMSYSASEASSSGGRRDGVTGDPRLLDEERGVMSRLVDRALTGDRAARRCGRRTPIGEARGMRTAGT